MRVVFGGYNKKQDQSKSAKQTINKPAQKPNEMQSNWLVDSSDSDSVVFTNCSLPNLVSVPVTSVRSTPLVVCQANSHDLVKYDWKKERAAITEMNSTPVGERLKFKW